MHVRMPRLVESHVGSAGGSNTGLSTTIPSPTGCYNLQPAPREGQHAKPRPTWGPAVAALPVSRHVLHLANDQLRELLHPAVQPAACRRPTAVGFPLEGVAQGFVLAVLQHGDPPGRGMRRRRRRMEKAEQDEALPHCKEWG